MYIRKVHIYTRIFTHNQEPHTTHTDTHRHTHTQTQTHTHTHTHTAPDELTTTLLDRMQRTGSLYEDNNVEEAFQLFDDAEGVVAPGGRVVR